MPNHFPETIIITQKFIFISTRACRVSSQGKTIICNSNLLDRLALSQYFEEFDINTIELNLSNVSEIIFVWHMFKMTPFCFFIYVNSKCKV